MPASFVRRTYQPSEIIFREGDPGDSLYVVEQGAVEIWRGDGEQRWVLGRVGPGGVFGEMAIFDRQPRMASASAAEEAVLLRVPASVLRQAMAGADPLLVELIRVLLDNLRNLARQLDERGRA
jgi:CRP/FNR family transcriptional regulator, cyclic AMP receptor protein